jgi:glycosyltransferase involved in cell wall biosynthesis
LQEKKCHRILYIVSQYPWPLDSGIHNRQYLILLSLAKFGDVDLLVIPPEVTDIPKEIEALCREIFVYPRNSFLATSKKSPFSRLMQVYREISGWPLDDKQPKKNKIPVNMLEVLKRDYDLVWIARLTTALRIAHRGGKNVVLDLDDIEQLKIMRMAKLPDKNPLKKLRLWIWARAWGISEKKALYNFACVVVCSEKDKKYLGNSANIAIMPNGCKADPDVKFTAGVPGRMLYVGNMEYIPNDDAVCYFIKDILPKIKYHNPKAHLVVVGANPSKQLRDIVDGKTVQLFGKVDDVVPYLQESALSVVPLRFGGGTRVKILESLAHKTPVVSTTIGAEGLELEHDKHIIIADGSIAFADACINLLDNQKLRMQLAEEGYNQVYKKYSWSVITNNVGGVVKNVLAQSKQELLL